MAEPSLANAALPYSTQVLIDATPVQLDEAAKYLGVQATIADLANPQVAHDPQAYLRIVDVGEWRIREAALRLYAETLRAYHRLDQSARRTSIEMAMQTRNSTAVERQDGDGDRG